MNFNQARRTTNWIHLPERSLARACSPLLRYKKISRSYIYRAIIISLGCRRNSKSPRIIAWLAQPSTSSRSFRVGRPAGRFIINPRAAARRAIKVDSACRAAFTRTLASRTTVYTPLSRGTGASSPQVQGCAQTAGRWEGVLPRIQRALGFAFSRAAAPGDFQFGPRNPFDGANITGG